VKNLARIAGFAGMLAYITSVVIRVAGVGLILNASPEGWWRAAVGLVAIGMFFSLLHIGDALEGKTSGGV
jgi:hypothetical protein